MSNLKNPIINEFGTKMWFDKNGALHREDGPAVEYSSGVTEWYQNGKVHRIDGPAIEKQDEPHGHKIWYFEDKVHREDGPAVENFKGINLWYWHNQCVPVSSQEEFKKFLKLKAFW